jgi:hypothetical protein
MFPLTCTHLRGINNYNPLFSAHGKYSHCYWKLIIHHHIAGGLAHFWVLLVLSYFCHSFSTNLMCLARKGNMPEIANKSNKVGRVLYFYVLTNKQRSSARRKKLFMTTKLLLAAAHCSCLFADDNLTFAGTDEVGEDITENVLPNPDYLAALVCVLTFFTFVFNFVLIET